MSFRKPLDEKDQAKTIAEKIVLAKACLHDFLKDLIEKKVDTYNIKSYPGFQWIEKELWQENPEYQWLEEWYQEEVKSLGSQNGFYKKIYDLCYSLTRFTYNSYVEKQLSVLLGRINLVFNDVDNAAKEFGKIWQDDLLNLPLVSVLTLGDFYLHIQNDNFKAAGAFMVALSLAPEDQKILSQYYQALYQYLYEPLPDFKTGLTAEIKFDAADFSKLKAQFENEPGNRYLKKNTILKKLIQKGLAGDRKATLTLLNKIEKNDKEILYQQTEAILQNTIKPQPESVAHPADLKTAPSPKGFALMLRGAVGLKDDKPNYPEIIQNLEEAIHLYNVDAFNERGVMHLQGLGGSPDYTQAKSLFERAINSKQECPVALHNLGELYRTGYATSDNKKDYQTAIALYQEAIELGYAPSINALAYHYLHGLGLEKNLDQATKYYETAAALGNPTACWQLYKIFKEQNKFAEASRYLRAAGKFYKNEKDLQEVYGSVHAFPESKDIAVFYHTTLAKNASNAFKQLLNQHPDEIFTLASKDSLLTPRETASLLQENIANPAKLATLYLTHLLHELLDNKDQPNLQRFPKVWLDWLMKTLLRTEEPLPWLESWVMSYAQKEAQVVLINLLTLFKNSEVSASTKANCHVLIGRLAVNLGEAKLAEETFKAISPADFTKLSNASLQAIVAAYSGDSAMHAKAKESKSVDPAIHAALIALRRCEDVDMKKLCYYFLKAAYEPPAFMEEKIDNDNFKKWRSLYLEQHPTLNQTLQKIPLSFEELLNEVFAGSLIEIILERIENNEINSTELNLLNQKCNEILAEKVASKEIGVLFSKLANQGPRGIAWMLLGEIHRHEYAKSQTRDKQKEQQIIEFYDNAIKLNNKDAMVMRALCCELGIGEEDQKPNLKNAKKRYEDELLKTHPIALNYLAHLYHQGQLEGKPNLEKAKSLYVEAAKLGYPYAMLNLAKLYTAEAEAHITDIDSSWKFDGEAARYYRMAKMNFTSEKNKEIVTNALQDLMTNKSNNDVVMYHAMLGLGQPLPKGGFGNLNQIFIWIAQDALLSEEERETHLNEIAPDWLTNLPSSYVYHDSGELAPLAPIYLNKLLEEIKKSPAITAQFTAKEKKQANAPQVTPSYDVTQWLAWILEESCLSQTTDNPTGAQWLADWIKVSQKKPDIRLEWLQNILDFFINHQWTPTPAKELCLQLKQEVAKTAEQRAVDAAKKTAAPVISAEVIKENEPEDNELLSLDPDEAAAQRRQKKK